MPKIVLLAVIITGLFMGAAFAGPAIGTAGGGSSRFGGWTLEAFELYTDWDNSALISGRLGLVYLPPLFPQEPPALYFGIGPRLAIGNGFRAVAFGTGGFLVKEVPFRGSIANLAGSLGVELDVMITPHFGLYGTFSLVAATGGDPQLELYFPWRVGFLWAL